MNKEEKKLLEIFIEKCQKYDETVEVKGVSVGEESRILDTVVKALNLIQKQSKIIDKFSKALVNCVGTCPIDYNDDFENDCENCQDTLEKCWIEYFKKEVEEDADREKH